MKWFKHYCNSLSDPFIEEILDEFKATGYLAYFGLIELIGQDNGHILTGKLRVKPSYLKRKLRTSPAKLQQVYEFCLAKGKLSFRICGEYWEFEFIKIAEIKDNHTTNLQAACKLPSLEKEKEEEKERERDKKKRTPKNIYGEFKKVRLTKEEYLRWINKVGERQLLAMIKILDRYREEKGLESPAKGSDNLTLGRWVLDRYQEDKANFKGQGSPEDKADIAKLNKMLPGAKFNFILCKINANDGEDKEEWQKRLNKFLNVLDDDEREPYLKRLREGAQK